MINNLSNKARDRLVYLGLVVASLIPITAFIMNFILSKSEGLILGRVSLDYLYSLGNSYAFAAMAYSVLIAGFFILTSFIDFKKLGMPMTLIGILTVVFNSFLFNIKPINLLFTSFSYIIFLLTIFLVSLAFLVYRLDKVDVKGIRFAQVMTVLMLFNLSLATLVHMFAGLTGAPINYGYFSLIAVLWLLSFVYLGVKKLDTGLAYFFGIVALISCVSYIVLAEETNHDNLASLISQKEQLWFFGGREDSLLDDVSLRAIEEKDIKVCADQKFSEDPTLNENYVQNCIYKSLEKLRWKDFEICSVIEDPSLENACASAVMSRYSSSTVCEQIKDTYPEVHQECLARFGLNSKV